MGYYAWSLCLPIKKLSVSCCNFKEKRQVLEETAGHPIMTLSPGDLYCCLIRQESRGLLSFSAEELLKPQMLDIGFLSNQSNTYQLSFSR